MQTLGEFGIFLTKSVTFFYIANPYILSGVHDTIHKNTSVLVGIALLSYFCFCFCFETSCTVPQACPKLLSVVPSAFQVLIYGLAEISIFKDTSILAACFSLFLKFSSLSGSSPCNVEM